jgi:hypothetical protein
MPHFTLSNTQQGPLISIYIGVSMPRHDFLKTINQSIPPAILAKALVDTGASHTSIDISMALPLGLTEKRRIGVITPSTGATPHQMPVFDVAVFIPMSDPSQVHGKPAWEVTGGQLKHQGFEVLLGRDILADGLLVYDGKSNMFTLSF